MTGKLVYWWQRVAALTYRGQKEGYTVDEVFDFGLRLKALRRKMNLSQQALAQRLGVSKGSVYRYESNTQTPSLEMAVRMAVLFRVSLDYLTGLDDRATIQLDGLSARQEEAVRQVIACFLSP